MPFHARFNEKTSDPNHYFKFIRAHEWRADHDEALELMRALAAQVKPICKKHGLSVNAFDEYEWNREFAGRNWNGGEIIELVLRRPNGQFAATQWLVKVLAHELAHIKHMNHGSGFQKFNAQLRKEISELQMTGYFGDGLWSDGRRLQDGMTFDGNGIQAGGDLPELLCGGAAKRRPKFRARRRRASTSNASPRNKRGTEIINKKPRNKPGTRVRRKGAFVGDGNVLSEDPAQSSYRRQTQSKLATVARAEAAERRQRHDARRARGEASDTDASEEEEEEDELEQNSDEGDGQQEVDDDIELTKEERAWLRREARGDFDNDLPNATGFDSPPRRSPPSPKKRKASDSPSQSNKKAKAPVVINLDSDSDDEPHRPVAGPSGSSSGGWTCGACTMKNSTFRRDCATCTLPRR